MKLAIKGHATRGKEIIQLLEMLGGVNKYQINAIRKTYIYFVDEDGIIRLLQIDQLLPEQYIVYSLEEFEEKFPYKVGDIVKCHNIWKGIIESMEWYEGEVLYHVRDYSNDYLASETVEYLQLLKEENMEEIKSIDLNALEQQLDKALAKETTESLNKWMDEENMNTNNLCTRCVYAVDNHCGLRGFTNDFNRLYCSAQNADKLPNGFELQPDGYFSWVDSKPQYPKTYIECAAILNCFNASYIDGYKNELLEKLQELLICRDAYWKLAGEQMGLGKPWGPDWESETEQKYTIVTDANEICSGLTIQCNAILAFPTEEMRDAFFANFKNLIEQCKELL